MKVLLCLPLIVLAFGIQDSHAFAPPSSVAQHSVTTTRQTTSFVVLSADSGNKNSFSMPDIDFSSISESIQDGLARFEVEDVIENVKGDNEPLGLRGEYYAVVQLLLIFFVLIGGVPFIGPPLQAIGGPGLFIGGIIVTLQAFADLGSDSLSPFPSPPKGSALKMNGIYSKIRHPMYTGLLMIMAGFSIATNSADRLLLTGILWYFLEVKADKEEAFLTDMYGPEYTNYKQAVPGKFLPADLMDDMPWNKE